MWTQSSIPIVHHPFFPETPHDHRDPIPYPLPHSNSSLGPKHSHLPPPSTLNPFTEPATEPKSPAPNRPCLHHSLVEIPNSEKKKSSRRWKEEKEEENTEFWEYLASTSILSIASVPRSSIIVFQPAPLVADRNHIKLQTVLAASSSPDQQHTAAAIIQQSLFLHRQVQLSLFDFFCSPSWTGKRPNCKALCSFSCTISKTATRVSPTWPHSTQVKHKWFGAWLWPDLNPGPDLDQKTISNLIHIRSAWPITIHSSQVIAEFKQQWKKNPSQEACRNGVFLQ